MAPLNVCPIPVAVMFPSRRDRRVVFTEKPLDFKIKPKHIAEAKCGDPTKCVIAQALIDAVGPIYEQAIVGARTIKIICESKIVMYRTPAALRRALQSFDRKTGWTLPPGDYSLLPFPESAHRMNVLAQRRHRMKRKTKNGKLSVFQLRTQLTRIVPSVWMTPAEDKPKAKAKRA